MFPNRYDYWCFECVCRIIHFKSGHFYLSTQDVPKIGFWCLCRWAYRFSSLQFLPLYSAMWSVNPNIIFQDVLCCFNSFCPAAISCLYVLMWYLWSLFCYCAFFKHSFFLFLCRWRGTIHHISYKDDDGCLVDVCFNCHLLIYCQSCSLSHHHTDRKLHTVSIQQLLVINMVVRKWISMD